MTIGVSGLLLFRTTIICVIQASIHFILNGFEYLFGILSGEDSIVVGLAGLIGFMGTIRVAIVHIGECLEYYRIS